MKIEVDKVFHNPEELFPKIITFPFKVPPTDTSPGILIISNYYGKEICRAYFCNSCAGWIPGKPDKKENDLKCRLCGKSVITARPTSPPSLP